MAWYSILPDHLIHIESWVVRFFIFLGIVTILPWAALLVFDMVLYIWRMAAYEVPVVGGRARGMQRPRAPSLNELPERYGLSVGGSGSAGGLDEPVVDEAAQTGMGGEGGLKNRGGRTSEAEL